MANTSKATTAIGTLVARVEAPTMVYRITSHVPGGALRVLPYRRSGDARILAPVGGLLVGDGSRWLVVEAA